MQATAEDQTARILAEIGTAAQRATYAIHEAQRRYRERAEGLADSACALCWDRERATLRRELVAALIAFDQEREAGESDTYVISAARDRIRPLSTFEAWCHSVLSDHRTSHAA